MQDNLSDATRFIIRALADDYESLETLANYYTALATPAFSRSEVNRTLEDLVADEYVQPYLYSESDKKFAPSQFSPATSG